MSITVQTPSGRRLTVDSDSALIGRDPSCDIALPEERSLRPRHARIKKVANTWIIESQGDWTIQVGSGVAGRQCRLTPGDNILLTPSGLRIVFQPMDSAPPFVLPQPQTAPVPNAIPTEHTMADVKPGFISQSCSPTEMPTPTHFLDTLLTWIKPLSRTQDLIRFDYFLMRAGHYTLILGMAALLAFYLLSAVKLDSLKMFLVGVMHLAALIVFQYAAVKQMAIKDRLIRSMPVWLSSVALLDLTAVASLVGGIAGAMLLMVHSIQTNAPMFLVAAVLVMVLCGSLAWHALNPAFLNVRIRAGVSVGEEAVGNLSILVLLLVQSAPIVFAVGTAISTAGMLVGVSYLFARREDYLLGLSLATTSGYLLVISAAVPIIGYFVFLIGFLVADVIRSRLAAPRSFPGNDKRPQV